MHCHTSIHSKHSYSPIAFCKHNVCRRQCNADIEGHNGDIIVKLLQNGANNITSIFNSRKVFHVKVTAEDQCTQHYLVHDASKLCIVADAAILGAPRSADVLNQAHIKVL